MKIEMDGFGKSKNFDEILSGIWNRPLADRYRLLKTVVTLGYITDGYLMSKTTSKEVDEIQKLHRKTISGSDSYKDAEPFDILNILPQKLGATVERISYVGKGSEYKLVLVTDGHGLDVLVEALACCTLLKRSPSALWLFSYGRNYWKKPIVLLESEGFLAGKLLGAISPVQIKDSAHDGKSLPLEGTKPKVLSVKGKDLKYIPDPNEED